MREFYSCKLCEAIAGQINLYRAILVSHYNYAWRHVYIVLGACQTVTLFNASSSCGDGSTSFFPSHGVLAYSRRHDTWRYRDTVGKCRCPTRGASRTAEKA